MSDPLPSRLALSTCWNSHRHTDGYAMVSEIRELGFSRMELSHGIPAYLVEGILRALDEKIIQVGSVHNFCPLPAMINRAAPNLFQPSAGKKLERRSWLRYSLNTLEFAVRTGATHVVMHSGSLSFRYRSPVSVLKAPNSGESEQEKALHRLQKRSGKIIPGVRSLYEELLTHAKELQIVLGVENREGILELPLDSDMAEFLSEVDDTNLAYWHDTGHAEIKNRLGLLDTLPHLETLSDRLVGFHLHDVNEAGRDHQPVGTGTVDFRQLAQFIRPEHLLVVELSPRLTPGQVTQSRDSLLDFLS